MSGRLVGLSVDVDSVATHLAGYGWSGLEPEGEVYRTAIPRLLEIFEEAEARATFFLIAGEAAAHPAVVRSIVERGHEVASHSWSHPVPLTSLSDGDLDRELADSRAVLQTLSGTEVVGFRAPSFDVDARVLGDLVEAGYTYDASAFPSVLMPLLRLAVARRARTSTRIARGWGAFTRPSGPRLVATTAGPLVQVPVSTTPVLRLAHYHTLRFLLPDVAFRVVGGLAALRRWGLSYVLHAVDVLGADEDGLDPRMSRHPGMDRRLEAKLSLLDRTLQELRAVGPLVPLRRLVDRVAPPRV